MGVSDWRLTQLRETGYMPVTGHSVGEILETLKNLGIDPHKAVLIGGGNLFVHEDFMPDETT